ncbi:hypothetical protein [Candidatus Endomicrobiellum agilis]|uniref:hypothetical protein n=1 Tax=Candidatus Endomicrobiellum agilis TaxID=3238957 RepID=UPI00357BA226|nr:hypothetical protein [Endomicrobium sp.]
MKLKNSPTPKQFFEKLQKLISANRKNEAKSILDNAHSDILNMACKAIKQEYSPFKILSIFEEIQPRIILNWDSFIKFIRIVHKKTIKDICAFKQYELFKSILENNESQLELIEAKLKEKVFEFTRGYISTFYTFLLEKDFLSTHARIVNEISETDNMHLLHGYITAIGKYNYTGDYDKELNATIRILESLQTDSRLHSSILYACENLIKFSEKIPRLLLKLKDSLKPDNRQTLLFILSNLVEGYLKEDWFNQILFSYTGILSDDVDPIDNILCKKIVKGDIATVKKFLHTWAKKINLHQSEKFDIRSFHDTINAFHKESDIAKEMIIEMLDNENCSIFYLGTLFLDTYQAEYLDFNNFSFDFLSSNNKLNKYDYIYISKKLIGHYSNKFNTMCPLIFSIMDNLEYNDSRKNIIRKLFIIFIGFNFPQSTIVFLKNKLVLLDPKEPKTRYISSIIDCIETHIKPKNELPPLKELEPPDNIMRKLSRALNERYHNGMMEAVKKESILLWRIRQTRIKYGIASFSYNKSLKDYPEPQKMGTISFSSESPLSGIYSPIPHAMCMLNMLNIKKGL